MEATSRGSEKTKSELYFGTDISCALWVKMAKNVNGVEVHYNLQKPTGIIADIKIK